MPDHTLILPRLEAVLRRMVGGEAAITADTDLIDELQLDSLKVMNLVLEIEDEFDVTIPLNTLADVRSVGDLARVLERKGQGG